MKTEVKNDNELIAEFMGGHRYGSDSIGICWEFDSGFNCDDEDLKYNSSWSWLIPVVGQFIEKAKGTDMPHALYMNVATFSVSRPIGELYENLVKGIRWYNEHFNL